MYYGLKQNKAILRSFMRDQYSDDRLVMLLDHARAGKLAFISCCCFIGVVTATHELRGGGDMDDQQHFDDSKTLPGAGEAERAYNMLALPCRELYDDLDMMRRNRLIPMILAELKRRRAPLPEVTEDGHDLWLTHSSEGFYVQG